jgi:predicted ABC-type ATPase
VTPPRFTLIAGANGCGKTTLASDPSLFRDIPVLNPDAIGKTLQSSLQSTFPIAAARTVLNAAKDHIRRKESFAVETTLSGRGYLQMMRQARRSGFEIVLVYIGTEDVEINLARIKNRVLAGGHDVPEEDVRRRFGRSFANLPAAIKRADHSILFDNSTEDGYRLFAVIGATDHLWLRPPPHWAKDVAP